VILDLRDTRIADVTHLRVYVCADTDAICSRIGFEGARVALDGPYQFARAFCEWKHAVADN